MGKDEQIQLILGDEDLVRRVKEWISRREEIQQASVAASNYSLGLETFLVSLPDNDFDEMVQELGIRRALSSDQTSSQDHNSGLTGNSDPDVPTELNANNDADALPRPTAQTMASNSEMTPQAPKVKASDAALARAAASSTRHAVFDVYDLEEEESKLPMASNWKFPPPSESKIQDIEPGAELNTHVHRSPANKSRKPDESNQTLGHSLSRLALSQGGKNVTVTESENSQTSDSSSLESFEPEGAGSHQNVTTNMSNSAEQDNEFDQGDVLRQPSFEASDLSPGSSSDESSSVRTTSRASTEEPASDHATEHDASALPEGNPSQSVRPPASNYQQHSHELGHEYLNDARESTSFAGHNPPQLPATLQAAARIAVGQVQNQNSQQLNLQNPSQIPPETLHTIVMMLERELRRGNRITRCDSCTNLQAELKNLRKSCRCLGQQLELLKWNYILLEEFIKNLEEMLKQKEDDNKESLKVIRYFHEKLVERKNEIFNLKKEIKVMRNKFEKERKQLYERAEKESNIQTDIHEQMKEQTRMLENVKERVSTQKQENQVLQRRLKQKSEESHDLLKENNLLKEENKELREKQDNSDALIKQLMLRIQTLEEERKKEKEAYQLFQDEYSCRETQFNERIQVEIKELMELFENLRVIAQRHGYSNSLAGLNLERENNHDNTFPSP